MGFVPSNVSINDFIFVTIAERHGFRGAAVLIGLYSILLILLLLICYSARDMTGRMLIGGFIGLLFYHVFMNIGMCVLLVPITGIPLPFISYGGTFLLMMMFMLGLCQSVWIHRGDESIGLTLNSLKRRSSTPQIGKKIFECIIVDTIQEALRH